VPAIAPDRLIPAVEYVRMSTDMQIFSIDAQQKVIAEFAREHGYEVLRTYADPGQSGLGLRGRKALRTLLSDVLKPQRDFSAILIRDVSRWGRFQDPDEAAHYEFICRQAQVRIIYCAEPFSDNAAPVSTIVKHLKRVMAAEYSRELSERVSRARLYLARKGYWLGSAPIYGFRRLAVDELGVPQKILGWRERKALSTHRIRIIPGPEEEQKVVRAIFNLYVHHRWSISKIVRFLHKHGLMGNFGRPWSFAMVHSVLTSELCIGGYIFNCTTQKLQSRSRNNPEDLWVRVPDICSPLVSKSLFDQAQLRLAQRAPYTPRQPPTCDPIGE
jgi:DNA invertase Pin-like site-specific DNA recombinase